MTFNFTTSFYFSIECNSLHHQDRRKDSIDARSLSSRGSDGKVLLKMCF